MTGKLNLPVMQEMKDNLHRLHLVRKRFVIRNMLHNS